MGVYNPEKVSFAWGPVPAVGFQKGEMINFEFDNDEWTGYEGTRGEGGMVKSPSKVGKCTVTLQADSPTNAAWSALYDAGVPLPITVADRSGTSGVAFAREAVPAKKPGMIRADTKPVVVWQFNFVGGRIEHVGDIL